MAEPLMGHPSLVARIATGKLIGLVIGAVAFFLLPAWGAEDLFFRFGMWAWIITTGAVIGMFGVMTEVPVFNWPMKWWVRGPVVGSWMMLVLWLVAREPMNAIAASFFGEGSIFASGAWSIVDGIVLGLLIAGIATWFGGEGKAAAGQ